MFILNNWYGNQNNKTFTIQNVASAYIRNKNQNNCTARNIKIRELLSWERGEINCAPEIKRKRWTKWSRSVRKAITEPLVRNVTCRIESTCRSHYFWSCMFCACTGGLEARVRHAYNVNPFISATTPKIRTAVNAERTLPGISTGASRVVQAFLMLLLFFSSKIRFVMSCW